ncbi:MAG: mandelate racemase/muconate lactonizing enzyme family protein [Clostridiales bacterium]|nr:mandelate racemase/muconate lactonizing enzyme family protein [Clostridiales bacterium]
MNGNEELVRGNFNRCSAPSQLKITDIRFSDIVDAPFHCTLMKIYTNQGIAGLGEVRDGADRLYAEMLKSRLLGENPCNVEKLFRRIRQFGYHARQGGGVCGVEVALWDLAGKAWGVPVYQMLGGAFRDRIRIYCDTDVNGKHTGLQMGEALKKRMDRGFTFLKMDLGIDILRGESGTLCAPLGLLDEMDASWEKMDKAASGEEYRYWRNRNYDLFNVAHPFTGIHVTEKGLDALEEYVRQVRSVIGYEIPLAIDHFGHIGVEDCIRLCRRIEKYNIAWAEDMIPWQYTDQYVRLSNSTSVPICTGEDIYLADGFEDLLRQHAVSVIHPDILTDGGIAETKRISDLAQRSGVAMALHMAESPVSAYACVHAAAACENFYVLENHSVDVPWWDSLVLGAPEKIVENSFIRVPDKPGLGVDDYNDEVIREHLHPDYPEMWTETSRFDNNWSNDRLWS